MSLLASLFVSLRLPPHTSVSLSLLSAFYHVSLVSRSLPPSLLLWLPIFMLFAHRYLSLSLSLHSVSLKKSLLVHATKLQAISSLILPTVTLYGYRIPAWYIGVCGSLCLRLSAPQPPLIYLLCLLPLSLFRSFFVTSTLVFSLRRPKKSRRRLRNSLPGRQKERPGKPSASLGRPRTRGCRRFVVAACDGSVVLVIK